MSNRASIRPRNVTVERREIETMIGTAPPPLKLWLLLCSHLAIRSGTAVRLGPQHYDQPNGTLRFITKKNAPVSLPATEEIRALLDRCDMSDPTPFIRQLWKRFGRRHLSDTAEPSAFNCAMQRDLRAHRKRLGFTRRIVAHDLRRTTALALYKRTGDVRDVQALLGHRSLQSTIWYLDHDLRPVDLANLEAINSPQWRKDKSA